MPQSIIARERARGTVTQQANSHMSSSESASYSSNINKSSSSSTTASYNVDGSRNYGRNIDESGHYVMDDHQHRQGVRGTDESGRYIMDEPQQRQGNGLERELEAKPIPDHRALPESSQPPPAQAAPSQPTYQTKPAYTPKKGNVRIVGGKLFHVEDDVEGPISIQYIGDHPDQGARGYHVAKSSYPPVGKPRNGMGADGKRMHFIA